MDVPRENFPELETARARLRMFTPGDLDRIHPIFADPEVIRHIATGKPATREESEVALASIIRHWERHGIGRWAVVHKGSGELIGYAGLRMLEDTPEVVYLLARAYWRAGLGTELAGACLGFGFRERAYERIVAITKPDNLASQRVMKKVGMRYERDAVYYTYHVVQFGISRGEFRPELFPYHLAPGPES